eukprot:7386613-Prymnesium_polylepis.1
MTALATCLRRMHSQIRSREVADLAGAAQLTVAGCLRAIRSEAVMDALLLSPAGAGEALVDRIGASQQRVVHLTSSPSTAPLPLPPALPAPDPSTVAPHCSPTHTNAITH